MPVPSRMRKVQAVAAEARQVAYAGRGPVLLVNRDLLQPVILLDEGADPAGQQAGVLDPLGSIATDGATDLWAQTLSGTAVVQVIPGGRTWSPSPALAAAQVTASGVPLVSQQATPVVIPATTSKPFGPVPFAQPGYELAISLSQSLGGAQAPNAVLISLAWADSTSGLQTATDQWSLIAGTPGTPHQVLLSGPAKGNQVTLTIDNTTPNPVTASYTLLQNSRAYQRDSMRTIADAAIPGFTMPNFNTTLNILAATSTSVNAAGGTVSRLLPAWAGLVTIAASTSSATSDMELTITDTALNIPSLDQFTDSHGLLLATIALPRAQSQFTLTNHNAAAKTGVVGVIIAPPDL